MKKLLLLLSLCASSLIAQVEVVSESKEKVVIVGSASASVLSKIYSDEAKDFYYMITFRDQRYKELTFYEKVSFLGDETFEGLYDVLFSFFKPENKENEDYTVKVNVSEKELTIHKWGSNIRVYKSNGAFFVLSEKNLKKLFGKNDKKSSSISDKG